MSLYSPLSGSSDLRLRPATVEDADLLASWDREPHVIACSTDDPDADIAFGGIEWREELADQSEVGFYRIAEVKGRPIGVMQICDPHLEPTHYWGDIEPNLRAIDIWIGPADALNRGYGTQMMTLALDDCFSDPAVTAIVIDPLASNTDAHRFYRRLGFEPVGRRLFDADDCLVHRLERERWETRP
ncbi:GNAT family N-acetyltransferase [Brevundimonas sp.]|uniref:GNAT family N-acetyltransferase n=1 Tax=Brevundimonas sp. TaxID=1871086 RepID=UPI002D23E2A8|nr:GNAT family N-acetyltransferase [Brevundimonas sp.]HYC75106.1 GNAT family N-acetyltransferase [Brevundimonas sp.]